MKQIIFQEENVTKAIIDKIFVKKGQKIEANEKLAIILTRDKTITLTSPSLALVTNVFFENDDVIKKNDVLFEIEEIVNYKKEKKDSNPDFSSILLAREKALQEKKNQYRDNDEQLKNDFSENLALREKKLSKFGKENKKEEVDNFDSEEKQQVVQEKKYSDSSNVIAKKQKSLLSVTYDNFDYHKIQNLDQNLLRDFFAKLEVPAIKKNITTIINDKKDSNIEISKPIKLSEKFVNSPLQWNFVNLKVDISELINLLTIVKMKNCDTIDLKVMPFYLLAVNKALNLFPYFNASVINNELFFNWKVNLVSQVVINNVDTNLVYQNINSCSSRDLIIQVDESFAKTENYKLSEEVNNYFALTSANEWQFNSSLLTINNLNLAQINWGMIQKEVLVNSTGDDTVIRDTVTLTLAYQSQYFYPSLVSKFSNYIAFLISKPALLM